MPRVIDIHLKNTTEHIKTISDSLCSEFDEFYKEQQDKNFNIIHSIEPLENIKKKLNISFRKPLQSLDMNSLSSINNNMHKNQSSIIKKNKKSKSKEPSESSELLIMLSDDEEDSFTTSSPLKHNNKKESINTQTSNEDIIITRNKQSSTSSIQDKSSTFEIDLSDTTSAITLREESSNNNNNYNNDSDSNMETDTETETENLDNSDDSFIITATPTTSEKYDINDKDLSFSPINNIKNTFNDKGNNYNSTFMDIDDTNHEFKTLDSEDTAFFVSLDNNNFISNDNISNNENINNINSSKTEKIITSTPKISIKKHSFANITIPEPDSPMIYQPKCISPSPNKSLQDQKHKQYPMKMLSPIPRRLLIEQKGPQNYALTPPKEALAKADIDSDEEKDDSQFPLWARKDNLKKLVKKQYELNRDPSSIFPIPNTCDLEEMFAEVATYNVGKKRKRNRPKNYFKRRGSSGNWSRDKVTQCEEENFRKKMKYN